MRKSSATWLFTVSSIFLVVALLANTKLFHHRIFHKLGREIENKKDETVNNIRHLSTKARRTNNFFTNPSNVLVNNNNGATTTSNFTQGTSSILAFGNNVVIAFDDAGSYTGVGTIQFTGWAYSTDGGATFTDGGKLPVSSIGDAGEPCLARDNNSGRIYLVTNGPGSSGTAQVFRSDDNAVTWMAPVVGTPGGAIEDLPRIVVDNFTGTGNGNVYLMSRRFGGSPAMYFFRSTDNGATFGPSGGILVTTDQTSQGAYLAIGPDHSVYAFYYESNTIKMRKSTDQGQSFGAAVTITSGLVGGVNGDLGLTGIPNGTSTPASFRSNEFVQAAINPITGYLYAVYDNDGAGTDKADVFLKSSTDGGTTWSAAAKVNDDATATDQWRPTIAVMPDGSGLAVFYYSRQDDAANNNLFKYYGRIGAISGATIIFEPSVAVSDVTSYPEFGRDAIVNPVYMGDYHQAVATAGGFYVSWADNRSDLAGGAPRKDPNVYFSLVPPTGLTPVPLLNFSSASLSGGNGNGTIDFGETVNINVSLQNIGSTTATGITSTLTTTSPGVTITQANSAYADIAPINIGINLTSFTITTTTGFTCGPVQFTLTVNYNDSTKTFNFSLPGSGVPGTPSSFSNNASIPIPDLSVTDIPIAVSGFSSAINKATLSLYLTHTSDQDLSISLISPDGTSVMLVNNKGGTGDNFGASCLSATIFDDDATNPIAGGIPPFVGTFKPEIPLSAFIGKSGAAVNGTWILRIVDNIFSNTGTFQCATLTLTPLTCPNPVVAAGSTLVTESCSPANNAIDPGETVTASFCLQNYFGGSSTTNLVATLQNSGGVSNASAAQTYGALIPGGASVCKNFTFTANGSCGGTLTATLQLQDGDANLGTVTYSLHLGSIITATTSFSNNTSIAVPASGVTLGSSDPYPSTIAVSGLTGTISKLTVTLNGLNHTFPQDVDMLLVAPSGQKFVMLSDVIGQADWNNINYTLDDDGTSLVPSGGTPISGTFKPTNYESGDAFAAPAPADPYQLAAPVGTATFASVFNGLNPNGTWSLYVVDDANADVGSIAGGWTLNITTSTLSCCAGAPCILTCPKDTTVTNDAGQCGAIVNYDSPQTSGSCGTITASPASGSFFPFGTTTVNVASTSGSSCSFKVTVVPGNPSECAIAGRTSICDAETVQWCAPGGMTNYEWSGPGGFTAFTQCVNVHTPGVYTVAFTDANGCRKSCSHELDVTTCTTACAYTQGFYSNKNGKACYTVNGVTSTINSTQLMLAAFGAATSQVFGSLPNNRYFTLYSTDISDGDIFKMLPGFGNSQAIGMAAGGATYSNKNTWPLVPIPTAGPQKGKINNQLLSQTISLWFNLRTSNSLSTVDLNNDTLVTAAQTFCGSGIPTESSSKFGLPHDIIVYLNGGNGYTNNVSGLFQLANDVLGGINTAVSALHVQYAVATINNAFDGCRILTGALPYVQPLLTRTIRVIDGREETTSGNLIVTAFPNPYNSPFSLRINSPISGMATIEYFDVNGVKISEQRKLVVDKIANIVPYTGPRHPGALIYKITIGNYHASGYVIGIN